jgi:hypothetical protein
MKQFTVVLFASVLMLGLLGCEDSPKKPAATGAKPASASCSGCPDGGKCGDKEKCGSAKKCEKCPEGKCVCMKTETAKPAAKPAAKPGGCCPGH